MARCSRASDSKGSSLTTTAASPEIRRIRRPLTQGPPVTSRLRSRRGAVTEPQLQVAGVELIDPLTILLGLDEGPPPVDDLPKIGGLDRVGILQQLAVSGNGLDPTDAEGMVHDAGPRVRASPTVGDAVA